MTAGPSVRPVIERLTIRNYRVLRDVTFDNLTPLTVLFGPNGSGKSTVFDVFAFLHEAFTTSLRRAWDRRNRMGEIRSRGSDGGVEFELKYRENSASRLVTYRLVIRRFISGWYLSYLSADSTRALPDAGPQERLSASGDNLPNVVQYLQERHPDRLNEIFRVLRSRVPALERVLSEPLPDGRLLLRLKDRPFAEPILAKFASDGTLKLLAYLTVLYDPSPAPILGIEEPENQLHPRLLPLLADEAGMAAGRSQLLVTTHSPYFVDALAPRELWLIYRADDGYARCLRASDVPAVSAMLAAGAQLGSLWLEGYFGAGDPLAEKLTS